MSESRDYSKRERKKRGVNLSAIEQLKAARSGQTRSIDNVKDEEAVYDYVSEDQYADIVNDRLQEDFIVGDVKGSGYDDTGREVFDDEQVDWVEDCGPPGSKKKKRKSTVKAPPSGNIAHMLSKNRGKQQAETKTLGTDALLDELLTSLDRPNIKTGPSSKAPPKGISRPAASIVPSQTSRPTKTTIKPTPTRILQKKAAPSGASSATTTPSPFENELPEIPFKVEDTPEIIPPPKEESMDADMDDFDDDAIMNISVEEKPKIEPKIEPPPTPKPEPVFSTFNTTFKDQPDAKTSTDTSLTFDKTTCPTVTVNGEEYFRMYYLDIYENSYTTPGTVYLMGKVEVSPGKFTSATVAVRNVPRTVFVLPRDVHSDTGEEVKMVDVYNEFNDVIAPRFRINKFLSKSSSKKFAWNCSGVSVPFESEYLEVRFSAEFKPLPHTLEGKTFSRVFGTNQSAQESFILEKKLKGPSWILVKNACKPRHQATWSTYEMAVESLKELEIDANQSAPPPLTVISLSLKTMLNPKSHANEIVAVGGLVQTKFHVDKTSPNPAYEHHFAAVTPANNLVYPYDFEKVSKASGTNIEVFKSERSMLGWFVAKLQRLDPDIIVGYDSIFDIDVLLHRLVSVKIPHWSRVSRFKRTSLPKSFGAMGLVGAGAMAGRLIAATKISCKELIRLRKYDLAEFARIILREERGEWTPEHTAAMFDTSQQLLASLHHTLNDASFNLRVMFELMALPLSHQITRLCGNVWQRTLLGGRAERNEYLLLHAFTEQGFIVPEKRTGKMRAAEEGEMTAAEKKKDTYSGGLVLEPKKGYYDTFILLLDFNSLYPSIIQEYNVCFTTVDTSSMGVDGIAEPPKSDAEPGILPVEIRRLVERRKEVKSLLKKETPGTDKYQQYDIRQKALKLTANSMYGCLGFSNSRFYAKALAALVTAKGREALLTAKNLVESTMRLEVVYGDTDSIMINTHSTDIQEVLKTGKQVKAEVNKMYRLLEIDIDGVFKSMLLLKKKKYAAVSLHLQADGSFREEKELKGLDIVRRDWCELAKDAGNFVLDSILSNKRRDTVLEEIHCYLTDVGVKVKEGGVAMEKFVIHKSLTKAPHEYPDKKSQPHVQVALRLISQGKRVVSGDVIEYIICEDGSGTAPTQRAYHPSELAAQPDKLKIDNHYYLASQLHPVVSRLINPIEGTDAALIAECLGLDATSYRRSMAAEETDTCNIALSSEDRYKDCAPLALPCQFCDSTLTVERICDVVATPPTSGFECGSCGKHPSSAYIANKLTLIARTYVSKYYSGGVACEDSACGFTTRQTPLSERCPQCLKGRVRYVYSEAMLFNQLSYLLSLVDYASFTKQLSVKRKAALASSPHLERAMEAPFKAMTGIMERNAYSIVNMTSLFAMFAA